MSASRAMALAQPEWARPPRSEAAHSLIFSHPAVDPYAAPRSHSHLRRTSPPKPIAPCCESVPLTTAPEDGPDFCPLACQGPAEGRGTQRGPEPSRNPPSGPAESSTRPGYLGLTVRRQLHAHLSGSIDRDCLHEIWARRKQADDRFDLQDPLDAIPPGKVDYDLNT